MKSSVNIVLKINFFNKNTVLNLHTDVTNSTFKVRKQDSPTHPGLSSKQTENSIDAIAYEASITSFHQDQL